MLRAVAARILIVAMTLAGMHTGATSSFAQAPIEGTWRTQLLAEVTISSCPDGYCGHISKVVVPQHWIERVGREAIESMRAEEYYDLNNKDPLLRRRPILGLQILTLRPGGRPDIYDGEIYNPEDGNVYSGYVEVLGPDSLRLNGCVLFNILCRGEDWLRVPPL